MKYLKIISLVLLVLGCANNKELKVIEGEIYFKLIDSEKQFYLLSMKEVHEIINKIDDINTLDYFSALKKEGLINKPYIRMKMQDGSLKKVYFSINTYENLISSDIYKSLVRNSETIILSISVRKIKIMDNFVYHANEIKSVKKINRASFRMK